MYTQPDGRSTRERAIVGHDQVAMEGRAFLTRGLVNLPARVNDYSDLRNVMIWFCCVVLSDR